MEAGNRAMPVRVRRTRSSHEIMAQQSTGGGQDVNIRNADEVFAEHGAQGVHTPLVVSRRRPG
jgi:hypothetical protein